MDREEQVMGEVVLMPEVDRSGWPAGPWDAEGDRVEWRHEGLPCLMVRNRVGGWCGYVGVSEGHPWYGESYDDVDANVHGGLTYAAHCGGHVCHVPQQGESAEVYWLGFDCVHFMDLAPGLLRGMPLSARDGLEGLVGPGSLLGDLADQVVNADKFGGVEESYRDVAFVTAEVESLADQALAAVR